MWGVSGKVVLGVKLDIQIEQQPLLLDLLRGSPDVDNMVHLTGDKHGLSIWFSDPRQAGDFIVHWSSGTHSGGEIPIHPIQPPGQHIAIRPDDTSSVQESHMASEGMDTYSVCPTCREKGLHVLNTSAVIQKFGNSCRAIRFFCMQCQTVCDEPALGPIPPCPIPKQVLAEMRKISAGTPLQIISRPIDFKTFEKCVRQKMTNKAPGGGAMPLELGKYWRAGNNY
jgi:hypothetical protein